MPYTVFIGNPAYSQEIRKGESERMATSANELKERIRQEAKEMGIGLTKARVLSTDPFLVGTDKDYADARWAAGLWDKMMASRGKPIHLRGFHYWVQSRHETKPDGNKYAQKDASKDWQYLLRCAQMARYLGIGSWRGLLDLKHPDAKDYDSYFVGSGLERDGKVNPEEVVSEAVEGIAERIVRTLLNYTPEYRDDGFNLYHLEVWCEKNSMGFVIEPQCRKFGACYQPLIGQASIEKVNLSYERAYRAAEAGKRVRIFYISDWDRYGWSMVSAVARKLEFFARQDDLDIKVSRLGLNDDQIDKYDLPKAPKLGEAVVELDALEAIHPGELGKLVADALEPYFDAESIKVVRAENRRMREVAEQLTSELNDRLAEVFEKTKKEASELANGIDLSSVIDKEFDAPEPEHIIDESDRNWMYDSELSYWEQFDRYMEYKSERAEEEM